MTLVKKIALIVALALIPFFYREIKNALFSLIPLNWYNEKNIYSFIHDLYHPDLNDYHFLQKYLNKGKRDSLKALGDMEERTRNLRLVSKKSGIPQSGVLHINTSGEDREQCLIVYASYNQSYPLGLRRLIEHVSKSDFKGHILYKIGGWPNVEEGDLKLAHVPYAFKPCFFREAKRLGYKRVLWLDTSVLPVVSLNTIFSSIEKNGYFAVANGFKIGPFMNLQAAQALGVSLEECNDIPSCSAGLFGVDFSTEKGDLLIQRWYEKAQDPHAFFSPRSDQNVLSVLIYQLKLAEMTPHETMVNEVSLRKDDTLFIVDRTYVHKRPELPGEGNKAALR